MHDIEALTMIEVWLSMASIALLCNGTTLPDKIFDEDIIVRVNHGVPRKDKRTDIWFFGDGESYANERDNFIGARIIGYTNCMFDSWWERYPLNYFKYLCSQLLDVVQCDRAVGSGLWTLSFR